jgi:hypothetical protein
MSASASVSFAAAVVVTSSSTNTTTTTTTTTDVVVDVTSRKRMRVDDTHDANAYFRIVTNKIYKEIMPESMRVKRQQVLNQLNSFTEDVGNLITHCAYSKINKEQIMSSLKHIASTHPANPYLVAKQIDSATPAVEVSMHWDVVVKSVNEMVVSLRELGTRDNLLKHITKALNLNDTETEKFKRKHVLDMSMDVTLAKCNHFSFQLGQLIDVQTTRVGVSMSISEVTSRLQLMSFEYVFAALRMTRTSMTSFFPIRSFEHACSVMKATRVNNGSDHFYYHSQLRDYVANHSVIQALSLPMRCAFIQGVQQSTGYLLSSNLTSRTTNIVSKLAQYGTPDVSDFTYYYDFSMEAVLEITNDSLYGGVLLCKLMIILNDEKTTANDITDGCSVNFERAMGFYAVHEQLQQRIRAKAKLIAQSVPLIQEADDDDKNNVSSPLQDVATIVVEYM